MHRHAHEAAAVRLQTQLDEQVFCWYVQALPAAGEDRNLIRVHAHQCAIAA